jgi:hypothetical protein
VTFLLSAPGEVTGGAGMRHDGPSLVAIPQPGANAGQTVEVHGSASPQPPEIDAAFDVSATTGAEGRTTLGTILVSLDWRPSRLWRRQPPASMPSLKLIGVAVPTRLEGERVERFWIELDGAGRARISSLIAAEQACVVKGSRARLYSRREMRYTGGSGPFTVETISLDGEKRTLASLTSGELGFVTAPLTPRTLTVSNAADMPDAWSFDWISDALRVELSSGRIAPIGDLMPPRAIGAIGGTAGAVAVSSLGDTWVLDGQTGTPASGVVMRPGTRVVIGPLVLEA